MVSMSEGVLVSTGFEEYHKERIATKLTDGLYWNILGEKEVSVHKPETTNALLIRICNNPLNDNKDNLKYGSCYKNILVFEFADIDRRIEGYKLFNKEIRNEILKEVDKNYKEIIVHCTMGISRSSAVMYGIAAHLNKPAIAEYIKTIGFYIPNKLILEIFDL